MRILSIIFFSLLTLSALAQSPATDSQNEREELAMAALQALMSAPPRRALPLLSKVMSGDHSERVKSRALFVLSQISLPEAQDILIAVAKDGSSKLRSEAIRMIGISGHKQSLAALQDIYASGDAEIRDKVLHSYMIAGDEEAVYAIALAADGEKEFDAAIRTLGVMGATKQLRELSDRVKPTKGLIHAYMVSGDLDSLLQLAKAEPAAGENDLRTRAIHNVGVVGGRRAGEELVGIYRQADNKKIRRAALQALLVAGHDKGVLALYQESTDISEKRSLLRTLSNMGSDAALEAIDSALEGNQP